MAQPSAERGCLIVQENAAVLHGGRSFGVAPGLHIEFVPVHYWNVGPEIPGRNTDLLGEGVDAVDSATFVAPGDHQCGTDPGSGTCDHLNDERLPLARDTRSVELAIANQLVHDGTPADCAHDDRVGFYAGGITDKRG